MPQEETNATLSPREAIVDSVDVKTGVIGCVRTGRPIMVTGLVESDPRNAGGPTFYDLFLTLGQSERLRDALDARIRQAREGGA